MFRRLSLAFRYHFQLKYPWYLAWHKAAYHI